MAIGPGKHTETVRRVREELKADGVILIVFGGPDGGSFECQLPPWEIHKIASVIRHVAKEIERVGPFKA